MSKAKSVKTTGSVLKELRVAKKLTLLELSGENSEVNLICSERHLRRIERNERQPSPEILNSLLSVLDTSIEEFHNLMYGMDMRKFNNDFAVIWDLGYARNYQAFATKLKELKAQDYCNTNIPAIRQAILLCEASLLSNNDYTACLETACSALRVTHSTLLTKDNEVSCDKVAKLVLAMNEYRALRLIANKHDDLKNRNVAIGISNAIVISLENEMVNHDMRKKLLPSTYFNTSNMLLDSESYAKALDITKQGLDYCYEVKEYKTLCKLQCNAGRALAGIGEMEQALELFKKSYQTAITLGDTIASERLKAFVKNNYAMDVH